MQMSGTIAQKQQKEDQITKGDQEESSVLQQLAQRQECGANSRRLAPTHSGPRAMLLFLKVFFCFYFFVFLTNSECFRSRAFTRRKLVQQLICLSCCAVLHSIFRNNGRQHWQKEHLAAVKIHPPWAGAVGPFLEITTIKNGESFFSSLLTVLSQRPHPLTMAWFVLCVLSIPPLSTPTQQRCYAPGAQKFTSDSLQGSGCCRQIRWKKTQY